MMPLPAPPHMGTAPDRRHPGADGGPLVAFDFDGTLTCRDSFRAFLAWRAGPFGYAAGMAKLGPAVLAYATDRDRARLKAATARVFLQGDALSDLEAAAQTFAARAWVGLMRPDALACWENWRARGARLAIVTASPEFLVAPFARRLGAERLIATRLALDAAGRATAALAGPNCRGPEKVVRLRAAFGPDIRLEAAYGDSDGDIEMLALARAPGMKVFTGQP